MSKSLSIVFLLFSSLTILGQRPILYSASLSFDRLRSDINDSKEVEPYSGIDLNTPKLTYSADAQIKVNLFKNLRHFVNLDFQAGYDERKALEIFTFNASSLVPAGSGVSGTWQLAGVPTSPQNPKFVEFNTPGNSFPHFPNFKYFNTAVLPTYEFRYKRLGLSVGVGIFYNVLLNKKDLVFGREWFPWTDFIFEEPFNVSGEITYNKFDFGYIYQSELYFQISKRVRVFANIRRYKSKAEVTLRRPFTYKWRVRKYGFGMEYIFKAGDRKSYRFFERN